MDYRSDPPKKLTLVPSIGSEAISGVRVAMREPVVVGIPDRLHRRRMNFRNPAPSLPNGVAVDPGRLKHVRSS